MKLYFAYGANLNLANMSGRCPQAKKLCSLDLPDWRLVFKGVADIEVAPYNTVHGLLWEITDRCEASLDIFEGYPRLYRKEYFTVEIHGEIHDVMFYKMNREGYSMPSQSYFETIEDGYYQNKLPVASLWNTLDEVL